MFAHKPSHEHTAYKALLPKFFDQTREMEERYVEAGFPADGLTDFMIKWFDAWERRSTVLLRECLTDDLVYADPTGGCVDWHAGQREYDWYEVAFRLLPDLMFYPQDDTPRALPLMDFSQDTVRLVIPWRMIGRYRLGARPFNAPGVDRYVMRREDGVWRIARIDTDGDFLTTFGQTLPIPLRPPSQQTVGRLLGAVLKVFPHLGAPQLYPRPQVGASPRPPARRLSGGRLKDAEEVA